MKIGVLNGKKLCLSKMIRPLTRSWIVHKIYAALDQGKDVCLIGLDVSKAFDRAWHDGLLFKLKLIGIS